MILNRWRFTFPDGANRIIGVAASICNSRASGPKVLWETVAGICDDRYDVPFEFCYCYTIIAWTPKFPEMSGSCIVEDDLKVLFNQTTPDPTYKNVPFHACGAAS